MIIDTDKYVDTITAAKILGVTDTRVSALCKAGRFDGSIKIGRTRLIPRDEVVNFERLPPGVKKRPNSKEIIVEALRESTSE